MFGFIFCVALVLTGCATVSNIPNPSEDLLYFGGNSVLIGNHLYYANGYTKVGDSDKDFAYKTSANISYLSRLDLSNGISAEDYLSSPKGTEKVNDKVIGYENQYMFALGDWIYFTSANTHKTDKLEHNYKLVSFFRSRLNGDNVEEIFTTRAWDSTKADMKVLKGSDNAYYLVVYDGSELSSVKLGNKLGGRKILATDVLNIAMPGENDVCIVKEIFYTINHKEDDSTAASSSEVDVLSVNFATGDKTNYKTSTGIKTTFIGREGDVVFYTNTSKAGAYQTYAKDVSIFTDKTFSGDASEVFYDTASITNIQEISAGDPASEGYIFIGGNSKSVMYKNMISGETAVKILGSDNYTNILFVEGDYIYYSTDTGIFRISVKTRRPETIVEMESIVSGEYAYADGYIYFYGKFHEMPLEEGEESKYEEDTNLYMYRVKTSGNGGYQLISHVNRVLKKDIEN